MAANTAALDALVDIITSSVKEAVEAYKAYTPEVPPINTAEPGPFDSSENVSTKLNQAVKLLEGACAQLCATIAPAGHTIVNVSPVTFPRRTRSPDYLAESVFGEPARYIHLWMILTAALTRSVRRVGILVGGDEREGHGHPPRRAEGTAYIRTVEADWRGRDAARAHYASPRHETRLL